MTVLWCEKELIKPDHTY